MTHVCLILEGTYPYFVGGVSSWVHEIVNGMTDVEFSIVHLYSGKAPEQEKYQLPQNVRELLCLPILIDKDHADFESILAQIPDADLYHSLSTGFAGWIGTELKRRRMRPLLLTEHGIYWHEIELGADEIECGFKVMKMKRTELFLGKNWFSWLQFFKRIAKQTYREADLITTVCETNRRMELSVSANAGKCRVIHNGVKLPPMAAKSNWQQSAAPSVGLVGRVTPIKDIETFIRASARVRSVFPEARFYVIGPIEQDSDYYLKCKNLAEKLGLENLFFTGRINALNFYANLDLVALTSVSEGQPFALLEAMAAGIPVVATDVGGCDEIINGANDGLGQAGLLCRVGDVAGISAAMLRILKNPSLWRECAQNGRKRIEKFYRSEKMIQRYRQTYRQLIEKASTVKIQSENYFTKARSE